MRSFPDQDAYALPHMDPITAVLSVLMALILLAVRPGVVFRFQRIFQKHFPEKI